MDDHQIKELLENLEAWGEEFRTNQHGATLTILRARKTITDQAAMISQLSATLKNMVDGNHGATVRARTVLTGRCKHDAGHELNGVGMWICLGCRADITPESLEEDNDWGHPLAPGYYLKKNDPCPATGGLTPETDVLADEIYARGIRVSEIRMLEHACKMEGKRNECRARSDMNARDWRRQCLKSNDMECENRRLTQIIRDALMHLETNYDIDGASMKDSDAALKLRAAISSPNVKEHAPPLAGASVETGGEG